MKLLLTLSTVLFSLQIAYSQCSLTLNDSLYTDYSYVLNATNIVGQAPYQFNWTVTDGNGVPLQYMQNQAGDSITISAQSIQGAYGCIIYQVCMTDALNCTTCSVPDTSGLQVPFNCYSVFNSTMVGPNQFAITIFNDIPPFLIVTQFMQWTDGDGQGQGMPYMGPGTTITYTSGSQNTNDKFYLCVMSLLTTGGCLSCDSIPYSMAGIGENTIEFNLSPNPANDVLKISSDQIITSLSIIDINGSLVRPKEVILKKETTTSVKELPNGMYFIGIETEQGVSMKRFSVQH